ncbi:MAG: DUF4160 domain-containing protein [Spirochaetales bacterium]|nr:DUF4160 domain-containing protein [Spirochaetales bacterium]
MPTISSFYGIIIFMHVRGKDHNPPHIHAVTSEYEAPFSIASGELMAGFFPAKARALVKEFVLMHQSELLKMWEDGKSSRLPPLA